MIPQIHCFPDCSAVFRWSISLSALWLASCGEQSKEPRCKELAGVLYSAEWKSFATVPFVEVDRGERYVWYRARAKILITGYESCEINQIRHVPGSSLDETYIYECLMSVSTAHGDDLLAAAKTFAAPWQSCFADWKERSFFSYFDSKDPPRGSLAAVVYEKGDLEITFSSDIARMQSKPNRIALKKNKRR